MRVFPAIKFTNEILGLIVALATTAVTLLTQIKAVDIDRGDLLIGVDILNILTLLFALIYIKPHQLTLKETEIVGLTKNMIIDAPSLFNIILQRVNELIKQLVYCIRWFSIILAGFYILQLFVDCISAIDYASVKSYLENTGSVISLLHRSSNEIIEGNYVQFEGEIMAAQYVAIEILTNSANVFSAAFLFLAFQVLFFVSLEKDNKSWTLKGYIPLSIAIFITLINFVLVLVGNNNSSLAANSHVVRLIGGVYNGVAMFLLFSRFISMEYFFKYSKHGLQRNFYFYGTVLALPLYVVAQPLYGLFNAVEVGEDNPELFKSIVFLVCFWGKLIFLLFIHTMISKRWMHIYLFLVLSQKDTLLKLSKEVDDVDDLDKG